MVRATANQSKHALCSINHAQKKKQCVTYVFPRLATVGLSSEL